MLLWKKMSQPEVPVLKVAAVAAAVAVQDAQVIQSHPRDVTLDLPEDHILDHVPDLKWYCILGILAMEMKELQNFCMLTHLDTGIFFLLFTVAKEFQKLSQCIQLIFIVFVDMQLFLLSLDKQRSIALTRSSIPKDITSLAS